MAKNITADTLDIGDIEDEWTTSSGLPLANSDVEVVECSFGYNAKIGADVLCANFVFLPVDGDGDTIEQSFSVGKGWEAHDKGKVITRDDGRGGAVNQSTNYGRLIESAKAAIAESGLDFPFATPRIASGWVGTKWHIATEKVTVKNPSTGAETEKDAYVFTAYHGMSDGDAPKAKAAAGKGKAAAGKTSAKAAVKDDADDELDALRAKLVELAGECEDHDDFVEKALAIDGVENGPLERAVLKAKGDGSIWAEVNS